MRSRKKSRDKRVAFSITAVSTLSLLVVLAVFLSHVALKVRQKTLAFSPTSTGSTKATVGATSRRPHTEDDQRVRELPNMMSALEGEGGHGK